MAFVSATPAEPTSPPRLARELKDRVADLTARYSLHELLAEIARKYPKFDIDVRPAGTERACPKCGTKVS